MESRIIDLETKVAYQEDLLEQLNEVVTRQQSEIDELLHQLKQLKRTLKEQLGEGIKPVSEEEPPPHY